MKRFSKSYSTVENDRVLKGKSQETGKKKLKILLMSNRNSYSSVQHSNIMLGVMLNEIEND